jgi:sensor histidine kinase YesM
MTHAERQAEIQRLITDNRAILSTPLMSEGAISSTQVNRFSKRGKAEWQANTMKKMRLQATIRELSRTDEEIQSDETRQREKETASKLSQIDSHIKFIQSLGTMSHKHNGELKIGYKRRIDELTKEKP